MWRTLENWKLSLPLFTTTVIGWNVFTQRKLPFKIEFKYILFHRPAFDRLINVSSTHTTVSTWGKRIAAEQYKMLQYLDYYLTILTYEYACRYTQTHQVQWHISSRKPFYSSYMLTIWTTSCFSDIFIKPRSNPHCSIFHATFNKYTKFHTVLLQMHGINCIWDPKLANFYIEMYARRQVLALPPWHTFLCNYWQVWSFIHVHVFRCICKKFSRTVTNLLPGVLSIDLHMFEAGKCFCFLFLLWKMWKKLPIFCDIVKVVYRLQGENIQVHCGFW